MDVDNSKNLSNVTGYIPAFMIIAKHGELLTIWTRCSNERVYSFEILLINHSIYTHWGEWIKNC